MNLWKATIIITPVDMKFTKLCIAIALFLLWMNGIPWHFKKIPGQIHFFPDTGHYEPIPELSCRWIRTVWNQIRWAKYECNLCSSLRCYAILSELKEFTHGASENVTSSTKPEVHNVSQCRQRRTQQRATAISNMHQNLSTSSDNRQKGRHRIDTSNTQYFIAVAWMKWQG